MQKGILAMSLMLVMVLSLTACAGGPSDQEIVNGVIESLGDIRTGQFDMEMVLYMAGEVEGEAGEATIVMDFSGVVDNENKQMRADITMSMVVPGEDEVEMEMEMYLIGDMMYMMYMMMDIPEMGPMWMKSEMPEGTWEEMSQPEGQVELLRTAQVKVIGSERVRGVDCYMLELIPDAEQLWQLFKQQVVLTGTLEELAVTEEIIQEIYRNFSVKQWIAKDTYFITKAEIDMAVTLTPEDMGFPEEEGEVTMDIGMTYLEYNHNQPVSIVLPPEAEEAIEVPME